MKKIVNLLSLAVVAALAFTACTEESLVKSEIDAANQPAASKAPQVTELTCKSAQPTSLTYSFKVEADTASLIEVGLMYGTAKTLENSKFVLATGGENGVYTATVTGLDQETTYYAQAYAYQSGGNGVSSIVSAQTTFEPMSAASIDGAEYKAAGVKDAWDDEYDMDITIQVSGDTIFVCNFCPYFASYGYTAAKGYNYMYGFLTVNPDGKSGVISCPANQPMGYQEAIFAVSDNDGNVLDMEMQFFVENSGNKLVTKDMIGINLGGWYSLYLPFEAERVN